MKIKYFIEIGSCDFNTLNNFANHGWEGCIIDPMSEYLNKLEKKKGVHYVNAGMDHDDGERKIYFAPKSVVDHDRDFAGMSTFYTADERGYGSKHLTESKVVKTMSFKTLIEKYNIKKIDFLKIDTEGYDFEILKMFPWELTKLNPALIKVEHKYINNIEMKEFLNIKGYHVFIEKDDIYAIKL